MKSIETSGSTRTCAIRPAMIRSLYGVDLIVKEKDAGSAGESVPQAKSDRLHAICVKGERVGRNNASTFTGLCRTHDNNIFRPIDDSFPDHENTEHLFLLAYRAVLREYHVVLQNAIRFQSTYMKSVESGQSPEHEPCEFGMFATSHLMNAYEMHVYKTTFDSAHLGRGSSSLEHHVIQFANQTPTFAVSSLFSLDDVDAPKTPRVALTVYPNEAGVVAVVSATKTDSDLARPLSESIRWYAVDGLALLFKLCWHEGMHAGQITAVRKSLGLCPWLM